MCTKHCKAIGPPPKAITWDHTRQSIKLGVNQANTVVHIHRTGKIDEGNSTCGALFPAVTIAFSIQLTRSLSFFSLSLSLSRFFFVSLSLFLFVGLWHISFEQCHMLEGLFSNNLSNNFAIAICCARLFGQAIEPFHNFRKDMNGHECKMKGKCVQMKGR